MSSTFRSNLRSYDRAACEGALETEYPRYLPSATTTRIFLGIYRSRASFGCSNAGLCAMLEDALNMTVQWSQYADASEQRVVLANPSTVFTPCASHQLPNHGRSIGSVNSRPVLRVFRPLFARSEIVSRRVSTVRVLFVSGGFLGSGICRKRTQRKRKLRRFHGRA